MAVSWQVVGWTLARGIVAGIVLGALYRAWMRLLTTTGSFSWEGTMFIVIVVTVVTLAASVCATARSRWQRPRARGVVRVVAAALIVVGLGTPPASMTVPAFVLGGLAWGRTDWSPRVRKGLTITAVVATAATVPMLELGGLPLWRSTASLGGYAVLIAISSWLFAIPTAVGRAAARQAREPAPDAALSVPA